MTIPKEIIEKAIEGGWFKQRLEELPFWKIGSRTTVVFWKELPLVGNHKTIPKRRQFVQMSTIALDPTFWVALGKALEWFTERPQCGGYNTSRATKGELEKQKLCSFCNPHRFYDLILTGQPTDLFWQSLLAKN